ncbi:hypothetical protein ACLB0R_10575 [Sphingomonas sp. GlSt437]|uniref:hypothetical protein n=1 Tax=Sphingomonas sp. GlSt437 TaxID=3389970 RepID=UPI003A872707
MAGDTPNDPAALFREMLGQWENMANQWGAELLKTGQFSRAMHGATSAAMKAREVRDDMMARALDAAQMPSKADIADMSARLARVEESVARIEAMLRSIAAASVTPGKPVPPAAKPARTRKPPSPGPAKG